MRTCVFLYMLFTLLGLCVSSLRRGHANLLCIVPIFTDVLPKEAPSALVTGGRPGVGRCGVHSRGMVADSALAASVWWS